MYDNINENDIIREKLKKYIEENGKLKKFICEKIGVSQSTLSHFFASRTSFSNETKKKIYELLENN